MQSSQIFASQIEGAAQGGEAKKARIEENMSCLPVTIRQMEAAVEERKTSGEDVKFFGTEPKELIIVAAVEAAAMQGASLDMTLSDGTGRIKARHFVTEAGTKHLEDITAGKYICAFGMIRLAPTVHFAVNGVRLVESADEVSYHMIEVAHTALKLQQRSAGVSADKITTSPMKEAQTA